LKSKANQKLVAAIGLTAILALGAFLRFYKLGAYSIGTTCYAAAVKSMLTSWSDFFYVAFEPGGSVRNRLCLGDGQQLLLEPNLDVSVSIESLAGGCALHSHTCIRAGNQRRGHGFDV
jgi:hypothetical protein